MDAGSVSGTKMKLKKKKKLKAFHQKKKLFRVYEPRLAVLVWGIGHSMNELMHVPQRVMLFPEDFKAFSKIIVKNHNYNKENMPGHYKFKEYCPMVFQNLRERFCVDDQYYSGAFRILPNESESSGNSGSKFYESHDKAFIIKSIESEEVEMMHHLLPKYHQHIVECHADSLLPQYMGMYRITVDSKEHYYVVIRSVFSCTKKIHKKYDLKGSRIDRDAKDSEKGKDLPTFKDNDFTKDNMKITIGNETKEEFLTKLKKDSDFLSSLNLMDYSLLVGIHDTERQDSEDEEDGEELQNGEDGVEDSPEEAPPSPVDDHPNKLGRSGSVNSTDLLMDNERFAIDSSSESKKEIYYLGVIDMLTYYGATKKAAHAAKTVKHGAGADISTVKPKQYASRFIEFVESIIE